MPQAVVAVRVHIYMHKYIYSVKLGLLGFEWDLNKERLNFRKHRVTFLDAMERFFDESGFQIDDSAHSRFELRSYWVGKIASGKVLTTRFTRRGNRFRIIGCAECRKFKKIYEASKAEKNENQ